MINKQNLWFLTLFSLILVLSVYYVTMPNELLLKTDLEKNGDNKNNEEKVNKLKEYVKPLIIDKKIQEKKSIKPIEIINNEQTKEYIVKTSNSESLSMSEEEKNIPSRHINRTKASALSKRKVNNKVLIKKGTKKLTSAKKQQLEEEKITKPTKPLDVEVK